MKLYVYVYHEMYGEGDDYISVNEKEVKEVNNSYITDDGSPFADEYPFMSVKKYQIDYASDLLSNGLILFLDHRYDNYARKKFAEYFRFKISQHERYISDYLRQIEACFKGVRCLYDRI